MSNALDRDAQYATGSSSLANRATKSKQAVPTDNLPQMTPSPDLPQRLKSSQDTNTSREAIGDKKSTEARRESGGRGNVVLGPRPTPQSTDANVALDKELGSKIGINGATPSFPSYRKEYPSSSRIDPKLAQTMAMRMNANLDESSSESPRLRRTFSPPQGALQTPWPKTRDRPLHFQDYYLKH